MKKSISIRCLMAACTSVFMALSSQAQSSVISDWTNPGQYPFAGTPQEACRLHRETLSSEQCLRAMDRYEKKQCTTVYLRDGDIIDVSFTSANGVHQKRTLRVNFGPTVGADDDIRRAKACSTDRADGLKMVRPEVCGNWSTMTFPPPPPTQTVIKEYITPPAPPPMRYEYEQVCDPDVVVSTGSPGVVFSSPGTLLSNNCCCGQTQYIPGQSFRSPGTQGTYTIKGSCRLVRKEINP